MVNDLSGKDYTWFFDQWYYGSGYPVFETSWDQESDSLILDSYQVEVNNQIKVFKTHMDYQVIFEDGSDTLFRVWYENDHERFAFPVMKKVSSVVADPDLDILMKSSVYKTTLNTAYFELSPNPFIRDVNITFKGPSPGRKIYITNSRGQLMYGKSAEEVSTQLNLSALKQGIFLLVILTADGKKYTTKIVKLNE